jgi:hypothetical protein
MAIRRNRKLTVPESLLRTALLLLSRLVLINAVFTDPARCSPIRNQTDYPTSIQSLSAEAFVNIPHVATVLRASGERVGVSPADRISNGNLKYAIPFSTQRYR